MTPLFKKRSVLILIQLLVVVFDRLCSIKFDRVKDIALSYETEEQQVLKLRNHSTCYPKFSTKWRATMYLSSAICREMKFFFLFPYCNIETIKNSWILCNSHFWSWGSSTIFLLPFLRSNVSRETGNYCSHCFPRLWSSPKLI